MWRNNQLLHDWMCNQSTFDMISHTIMLSLTDLHRLDEHVKTTAHMIDGHVQEAESIHTGLTNIICQAKPDDQFIYMERGTTARMVDNRFTIRIPVRPLSPFKD